MEPRAQTAAASLHSTAPSLRKTLVRAQPSLKGHGHCQVTVSPYQKQRTLVAAVAPCLPCLCLRKAIVLCLPCAPSRPGAGGVKAMQQHNSPCHPCRAARKAFPSSKITAGYPTPNAGLTHLSLSRGARTPPFIVPHQKYLLCCAPWTRHLLTWGTGNPRKHLGPLDLPLSHTSSPSLSSQECCECKS